MKLIKMILLFTCYTSFMPNSYKPVSVIYYVDNSGSDANAGTSAGAAWQTIAKVNASTFAAGDQILFNKNGTWREELIPPSSGSVGNPIIIGSYGSGNKPLITGFTTLSGMTNIGNVWSATATSSVKKQNTVTVNGAIRAKGRSPNTGYNTFTNIVSTTKLVIPHGADNTGKEVAVRDATYIIDVTKVTSQNNGASFDTLNLNPAITYAGGLGGTGYFFQNDPSYLDTLNEWSYDSTSKLISVYATSSPTVQYSTIDTLINVKKKSYITFDGLSITGANMMALQTDSLRGITIQNCSFNNNGGTAIQFLCINGNIVQNDSIQNSLNNAIHSDPDTSLYIFNNYINHTGYFAGMGGNGNGQYIGIYNQGRYDTTKQNKIFNSGYMGIRFQGKNCYFYRNYVDSFGFQKDDGGGIYTFVGNGDINLDTGTIVRSNIVTNGIGAPAGGSARYSEGLYADNGTQGVTYDSNTVYKCTNADIFLHQAANITLKDNTCLDSLATILYVDGFYSVTFGLNFKRNILFSKNASQYVFYSTYKDSTNTSIDSNYYLRPVSEANSLHMGSVTSQMPQWPALIGYDTNSSGTPSGISSNTPTIYINPTTADSTFNFSGNYLDAKGVSHLNSITIKPYQSAILLRATSQPTYGGRIGNLIFN